MTSIATGTRSKTRCAKTVPTRGGQSPPRRPPRRHPRVDLLEPLGDRPPRVALDGNPPCVLAELAPARLVLEQVGDRLGERVRVTDWEQDASLVGHYRPVPGNVGGDDRHGARE